MFKKNKGFTLLEMIIVVAIMAILFLLSVPNISKIMKSVEEKGCNSLTKVVDTAIIQYKIDYNEFPSSINDLVNGGYLTSEQTVCSNGKRIYIGVDGNAAYE